MKKVDILFYLLETCLLKDKSFNSINGSAGAKSSLQTFLASNFCFTILFVAAFLYGRKTLSNESLTNLEFTKGITTSPSSKYSYLFNSGKYITR